VTLRGGFRLLTLAAVLAAASGCATPMQTRALLDNRAASGLPATAANEGVPFIPQQDLYCGPAATAMALNASGLSLSQEEVAARVYTPGREGTRRDDVVAALRRWGRFATPVPTLDGVLREVAHGNPVIVFQNLALDIAPQWHFAVAIGYDMDAQEMILHSGTRRAHRVSFSTFERTWARGGYWALAVTPPGRLPRTADEGEALVAAAGISRAGNADDAMTAFRTVVRRWPDSFGGQMGLGNAYYAADRVQEAERAFRAAAALRGNAPEPWNNLAYALHRQGRDSDARAAARRAVERAPHDDRYRQTLKEISLAP
jgi:tetratricopeptide (TPR) repeat protein